MPLPFSTQLKHLAIGACVASLLVLGGCKSEVYQGLTEQQANAMMAVLLKNGITPEKTSSKTGFTLSVENNQIVQTLELMRENNLPRDDFESLGKVFSAKGMISSATEEQARLAYALSQELSDTFSRIDGVLTSRVHVVLGARDLATGKATPPSAAIFLRHTASSQAKHLTARIRELAANAIPDLKQENVSVMLVPVRETVTVPMLQEEKTGDFGKEKKLIFIAGIFALLALIGLVTSIFLYFRFKRTNSQSDVTNKQA